MNEVFKKFSILKIKEVENRIDLLKIEINSYMQDTMNSYQSKTITTETGASFDSCDKK